MDRRDEDAPSHQFRLVSLNNAGLLLVVALFVIGVAGLWSARTAGVGALSQLVYVTMGAGFAVAGWFLLDASRRDRVGLLLVLGGIGLLSAGCSVWFTDQSTILRLAYLSVAVAIGAAVTVFPDGRVFGLPGLVAIVNCFFTGALTLCWPLNSDLVGTSLLTLTFIVICAQWWRFENSNDRVRRSLLWVALAGGLTVVIGGQLLFASSSAGGVVAALVVALSFPASLAVGQIAPDIADIRAVMARTALWVLVGLLILGVFALVTGTYEAVSGEKPSVGGTSLIATACALLAQPAQRILAKAVTPLLFGDRPDPLSAVSHVGDSMSDDPVHALRALRAVLAIPYAELADLNGSLAVSGRSVGAPVRMPLRIGQHDVGALTLGLRPGENRLTNADSAVLRVVTPALAQLVRSRALAAELHESRGQLIAAVEDERRRLRRDLHDELGPTLTGVAYAADAARNLVRTDPLGAIGLLEGLRAETATAIADIRRLVHGLRPPALDELGLGQAVRQRAASMFTADGAVLRVDLTVPRELPELSAAVEVAAYRIVIEALTNVARHAATDRAWVLLAVEDSVLVLAIRDDGRSVKPWSAGVGIRSMRERAEALGGTLALTSTSDGGCVSARLPL